LIACTVLALAAFAAALLTSSPGVLRVLVSAVCVGACATAVLLRQRERAAQTDLDTEKSARGRDEARFEERIAELEYQAEVAEEQVKRLERRVLAQRSQLAHAEAAHAQLLRDRARTVAEQALRDAETAHVLEAVKRGVRPTPAAYLKAANVLRGLERRAEQAESSRTLTLRQPSLPATVAPAKQERPAGQLEPAAAPKRGTGQNGAQSGSFFSKAAKPAAASPAVAEQPPAAAPRERGLVAPYMQPSAQPPHAEAASAAPAWARAALPPLRPAAAVLPQSALPRQGGAPTGAFNFFSRQEAAIGSKLGTPAEQAAVEATATEQDPADVIGEEAAAAQARYVATPDAPSVLPTHAHERTEHAIVDLTAEDETEPIDVRAIRAV
jgi:hypothetical protein